MSKTKPFGGDRCPNCGEYGSHFVPPCFGDSGFFACEALNKENDEKGTKEPELRGLEPEEILDMLVQAHKDAVREVKAAKKTIQVLRSRLIKASLTHKLMRKLLNKVNVVTSSHRHGRTITKQALDNLSNRQVEVEAALYLNQNKRRQS